MSIISTFAINKDNDIYLDGSNNIAIKDNINAIADIVLNKVRTNLGELQFNTNIGIPYFSLLFTSSPNIVLWQKFVEDTALSVEGVMEVSAFTKEFKGNNLSYSMTISTEKFGSTTINA